MQHVAFSCPHLFYTSSTTLFQGHLHGNDGKRYRTLCDITCLLRVKRFVMCEGEKKSKERFYLIKALVISAMCSQLTSQCVCVSEVGRHEDVRIKTMLFAMLVIMRIENVHKSRCHHLEIARDYHNLISHVFFMTQTGGKF